MTRHEVLQSLLDARESLDRICFNQGWGRFDDAVVSSDQCERIKQLIRGISDVGDEIDAAESAE